MTEAQDLSEDSRTNPLLSNLETDDRKLLQIVLMGQPELARPTEQTRIAAASPAHHRTLSSAPAQSVFEVNQYIQHRLEISGAKGAPYFTRPACGAFTITAKAFPRLVNALCDKGILAGFVQKCQKICYRTVGLAIRELGREHPLMSLINDALKRAKTRNKRPGHRTRPATSPREPFPPAARRIGIVLPLSWCCCVPQLVIRFCRC